jgi:Clp amino terminal domain, pathogenicity island component
MPMFERFTDRARRVVVLAQEEAVLLNHDYIGTEHLLLGLAHEGQGVAPTALESLGISLESVRREVEATVGRGKRKPTGHIPFTPRAKKALELSLREAMALGHNYIGTEHILLGLIREGEGVAAQVLVKLGADQDRVRQQVVQLLAGYVSGQGEPAPGPPERAGGGGYVPVSQEALVAMVAGGPGVYQEQEAPELVRVVPLAREIYDGPGLRILLISLEIWRDRFDLRYALLPERSPEAPPEVLLGWRVSDDVGTAYEQTGIATAGGRLLHISQLGFRPAPPEEARTLTVTVVDGHAPTSAMATVEIDLPAAA